MRPMKEELKNILKRNQKSRMTSLRDPKYKDWLPKRRITKKMVKIMDLRRKTSINHHLDLRSRKELLRPRISRRTLKSKRINIT